MRMKLLPAKGMLLLLLALFARLVEIMAINVGQAVCVHEIHVANTTKVRVLIIYVE
jgi:hypothetical protein